MPEQIYMYNFDVYLKHNNTHIQYAISAYNKSDAMAYAIIAVLNQFLVPLPIKFVS